MKTVPSVEWPLIIKTKNYSWIITTPFIPLLKLRTRKPVTDEKLNLPGLPGIPCFQRINVRPYAVAELGEYLQ